MCLSICPILASWEQLAVFFLVVWEYPHLGKPGKPCENTQA
uniref:Uncharacterized protein n=1 Tax=Anguilla anguilla TaxID=7936 RepID=A0A0E9VLA2_ANGAN